MNIPATPTDHHRRRARRGRLPVRAAIGTRTRRLFSATILAGLLGGPAWLAGAAAVPPAERLLPADTLGVASIPDYSRAREVLTRLAPIQFWNDPSMKAFREKFMAKYNADLVAPLEKEFGVKFSDYASLAQGQVTLAVSANGPKQKDGDAGLGFVLLVDARDQSAQLQSNLAALRKKWVDGGKQIRTDRIRDIEFTTLIFNSDDLSRVVDKVFPKPPGAAKDDNDEKPTKVEWLFGQSGSLFLLGNSPKDLEKVLVNQGGGGAGVLADQAAFAAHHQAHFRDANAYGWINLKSILELFTGNKNKEQGGGQGLGMSPDKIIDALGLNALSSVAVNAKESPEGLIVGFDIDAPESSRRGLVKMLAFEKKDASPPPFVPADTVKFSRIRLDLPKTWETLERTLSDAIPQFAGVVKMVLDNAGKDQDPNFDLRKSLIQNLGDDVVSIEKAPRTLTLDDLNSAPTLTLVSSARPEQLAASIRALTALMPAQASKFKEREFLGRKVYALGLPPSVAPGTGKPVERTLHYSASGGYVALTTEISLLEEYLRSSDGGGKSLRDTPGLADAAQKVGGMSSGLFTFENERETTRAHFETLKKESGTLANLFTASPLAGRFGMAGNSDRFKDWVDFSLLPPFDQVSKYFYHVVTSGAVTPQGFSIKVLSVRSPELKR